MYTWIIYDISLDKARNKTAKLCKQLGLRRVQKSVFLGKVKKRKLKHFRKEVAALVDQATDRVFIFQATEKNIRKMLRVGGLPAVPAPGKLYFY